MAKDVLIPSFLMCDYTLNRFTEVNLWMSSGEGESRAQRDGHANARLFFLGGTVSVLHMDVDVENILTIVDGVKEVQEEFVL